MRDFDFFKFMWTPYIPVFDNVNPLPTFVILTDELGDTLTDESGNILIEDGGSGLTAGDLYRYI